jgi:protein unc-80
LQEISEEMRSRCPQRKRSSSLPVPKIEVSLCSEGKTKDLPKSEFYRSEDGTSFDINCGLLGKLPKFNSSFCVTEAASPSPTPSERAFKEDCNPPGVNKRRPYKMADLKAVVESRLLSRSEKALEKVCSRRIV